MLFFLSKKSVFDANVFPKLIEILSKGESKTKKEAAWAVVNATSSGTTEQIRSNQSFREI
jgi:importin subunit alpha-1